MQNSLRSKLDDERSPSDDPRMGTGPQADLDSHDNQLTGAVHESPDAMKSFHFIHANVRLIPIHFQRSTIISVRNPEANQALPGVTAVLGDQKSGLAQ
jgi:hypothetical protein